MTEQEIKEAIDRIKSGARFDAVYQELLSKGVALIKRPGGDIVFAWVEGDPNPYEAE